ncbi:MAG: 16S rRNA (adenine(1518)-N(6)/adenine(1519)-N(6))-dimethyltransferase RsmA [Candidatus Bilamarchaeaceae archaeon]
MRLKKRLGQHLLSDKNILKKEAEIAGVRGRVVLEIGAGDGRLTEQLLEAGATKIYAVEKDRQFAEMLREKFRGDRRAVIIETDFVGMQVPNDVTVVIGNIPYYISSDIIFRLKDEKIERAVLMVQKEFAEKMVAKPGSSNYGRLSVTSQIFFDVEIVLRVPAHLFIPKPKVDSALIVLKPRGVKLMKQEEDLIRKLFQHKNKKIRNILQNADLKWAKRRPRELSPREVLQLIKTYSENSSAS